MNRAVLACLALAACPCAFALNPALDVSQYSHHAWTIRDGAFEGIISSIAQTPDGYLWLGTELGLLRFDGVRPVRLKLPPGQSLPSDYVYSLLAAHDGHLWIGTLKGLASWKEGKLTLYPELAGVLISALLEEKDGTIWAGTNEVYRGRLCAIRNGGMQCYGQDGSVGRWLNSLYRENGNLWVSTATGVWRWKPGPAKLYALPSAGRGYLQDLSDDGSRLLFSMHGGIAQIHEGKLEKYPLPPGFPIDPSHLFRDRDGGLWIGTSDRGLFHLHQGKMDQFTRADGLSSNAINWFSQDHEGNIWIATSGGLDRFREVGVPIIATQQGLSSDSLWSVLAARDGAVWLGTRGGLNRWKDGQVTVYGNGNRLEDLPLSLFQDDRGRIWTAALNGVRYLENGRFVSVKPLPKGQVHSIAEDRSGDFFFCYDGALVELRADGVMQKTPWAQMGRNDFPAAQIADPVRGGVWLGFRIDGGVAHVQDGQVRVSYNGANGLGKGSVADIQLDGDGTLWASTQGGLSRIHDGRITTLSSANGLPCDSVFWMREDDYHSAWLYMSCGLVRMARSELDAWAADPKRTVQTTSFENSSGVRLHGFATGYSPIVAKAGGKFWFVGGEGVSVLDPQHLVFNKVPPPVHIEQIKADGKTYDASQALHLPPLVRNIWIDYTALSLAAPEKVRFRFKLEGQDLDWREVVNEREAKYSNLRPRHYRFRLMACNESGVWNEQGASLDFFIDPKFYQTGWFYGCCAAAFLAMLWAGYRLRLLYLKREFNVRLEERVEERTRIARDLHDTLLQSFQGVLLKFHAVTYRLTDHPQAKEELEAVIERARGAVAEGRDAVEGLRSSVVLRNDLAQAITTFGEALPVDQTGAHTPQFRVRVEGASRDLVPILRDEAYRVACEALRNSFRHADAGRVEVEIHYGQRQFRVRVRDDGKGIDPQVLSAGGRAGHHGLPGMHERARRAGGQVSVWSERDSGTEIELTIPASVAYAKSAPTQRSMASGERNG